MIVGAVCLFLTYLTGSHEDHHMRFWTNFLHNATFFLGIAFMAGFVLAAFTTAYAGWFVQFKRLWEAYSLYLLPGLITMLMVIGGIWAHSHHLYHWNDMEAVMGDDILTHKSAFLNKWWYTLGTIIFVGAWYFFILRMRQLSVAEDKEGTTEYKQHRSYKKYAAIFLPIAGFTSAALIWQWIMSLDSHWYSTMFAWYATASWFCAMMSLTIMMLIYLKSRGYYPNVTGEHFHDLGKYLFAISIFWTYLWFSQYMLIWYGNVGEETIYFRERLDNYRVLFYANLLINFVLPFFVLMRNDTKRKYGTLFFASIFILFGHWLDFFMMIKPAAHRTVIELEEAHGGHHGEDAHSANDTEAIYHLTSLEQHDQEHATTHGEEAHQEEAHSEGHAADHATGHGNEHAAAHGDGHDEAHGGGHHAFPARYIEPRTGYTLPGFLEIGTFLGFLGGFLFFALGRLSSAPLEPKNDPYMVESKHHHT